MPAEQRAAADVVRALHVLTTLGRIEKERSQSSPRDHLLDHVIIVNEKHLRRRLRSYLRYYHGSRTHLALEKDAPEPRAVEPPEHGRIVTLPHVGGLHHRYVRQAA